MQDTSDRRGPRGALSLLASERPRNVGWLGAAALLFGDWGTSRLYVLGLAFLVAGRSSFYLILGMSLLTLAVGWAYTQICRIYPDGGGVYTAAKHRSRLLGVIGALLLFADYTVTASLSAFEAFHYFGLGATHAEVRSETPADAGDAIILPGGEGQAAEREPLLRWNSPGLWGIVSILVIGAFNLLGPKHTARYAIFAAIGMVAITLLVVTAALPQVDFAHVRFGHLSHRPADLWQGFVFIVLALSGVEAIANLTGVMKQPVYATARKSIWLVAGEVAIFNVLLAICMLAIFPLDREAHLNDMLAYLSLHYVGAWAEWGVRILGGLLLLSAANTAITDMISVQYLMARDAELPQALQRLNGFGAPWTCAITAAVVPGVVLLFAHDLETLASLYAIGVIGAVAINVTLCAIHPRLRRWWRKGPMFALGGLLIAIEVTLVFTKWHATLFACIVLVVGLSLRQATRIAARRKSKPTLLRQAIMEQLSPQVLAGPKIMLATAGSDDLAEPALEIARSQGTALVTCFVRQVSLSYKLEAESRLTLDTDPAAQALFRDFLAHGHERGVPIIPTYDTGPNAAELIAEHAAMNGVKAVLIGSSRRGALHHIIKGSFQRRLERLLPADVPVTVLEFPRGKE